MWVQTVRAELISFRWGSEKNFNLGEDLNQFFPQILLLFSIKFPNLGKDWSSDSHQFRPHWVQMVGNFWKLSKSVNFEISYILEIYYDWVHSQISTLQNCKKCHFQKCYFQNDTFSLYFRYANLFKLVIRNNKRFLIKFWKRFKNFWKLFLIMPIMFSSKIYVYCPLCHKINASLNSF